MIAGIYGMNFDVMPELHWRYGYPAVLLVIGGICAGLFRVFRRNDGCEPAMRSPPDGPGDRPAGRLPS